MITVLALDRSNGWVFARIDERILLLRPPYRPADAPVVSEPVVARAVLHHGYVECKSQFSTWADVVEFARREVIAHRSAEGRPVEEGIGRAILKSAPNSMIERFLDRIRTELIPRGDFEAAENMLVAIQAESPRLQNSPALTQRTAALLEDVRSHMKKQLQQMTRDDSRFRRLAKSGRLELGRARAQRVRAAGSMFVS